MNSMKRKKSTLLVCLGLVMALVLTTLVPITSIEVQAVRKVTSSYKYKKAPAAKTGTTIVTAKPYKGSNNNKKAMTAVSWVKFTVPKTGTYQFTFSDYVVKDKKDDIMFGVINMYTGISRWADSGYPQDYLKVKTNGGKSYSLYMCSPSAYVKPAKVGKYDSLSSRTATVKLKKGQIVFISFNNSNTITCKMKIKKK